VACRVKTDSDPAAIKVSILEVRIASREPHRKEDPVAEFEGGLVTIRRAPASAYGDLVRNVEAEAKSQKAAGRQDLSWIGNGAFAIGASVSGVPIWRAVAQHGRLVTAVQVSGARSKSSVATVGDFLTWTIARSGDQIQ
jgi:hypothetical protein